MINLVLGARLSDGSYKGNNLAGTTANSVDGWNRVQLDRNTFGGNRIDPQFGAQLFERDGKYIIAYRGTQPDNPQDWTNNIAIAGFWQQKMTDTIRFAAAAYA